MPYAETNILKLRIGLIITVLFLAYYYGKKKKRKPGRPPGGHTNLETGPGRPKKKRGRKKKEMSIMNQREKRSSVDSDDTVISETLKGEDDVFDDDNHSVSDKSSVKTDSSSLQGGFQDDGDLDFKPPRKKRKYVKHVPPPSLIKTRGAKLPKFTFEKRTHRKIALPSSSPQKATVRPQRQTHYKPEVKAKAEVQDFMPPKHHIHHPSKPRHKVDSTTGVESTYRVSFFHRNLPPHRKSKIIGPFTVTKMYCETKSNQICVSEIDLYPMKGTYTTGKIFASEIDLCH